MTVAESDVEQWSAVLEQALATPTIPRSSEPFGSEDMVKFTAEIAAKIERGEALEAWDDLQRHHRVMPDGAVVEAVVGLAQRATGRLAELLSTSRDVAAINGVTCLLDWSREYAPAWFGTKSSPPVVALGLQRWLRHMARRFGSFPLEAHTEAVAEELSVVAVALRQRPRPEEIDLWWQALGMIHRLCPRVAGGISPLFLLLNKHAAESFARNGGADAVSDERLRRHEAGNSLLAAIVPHVAAAVSADLRQPLLSIFFRDVERRLEGGPHDVPDVAEQGGLFYMNACGLAIELSAGTAQEAWWAAKVREYESVSEGWKSDGRSPERCAWLVCAACMSVLRSGGTGDARRRTAASITAITGPNLGDWMWEKGTPHSATDALPSLLVRAAHVEQPIDSARVLAIAREVEDAATLRGIIHLVGSAMPRELTDELVEMADERESFQHALA